MIFIATITAVLLTNGGRSAWFVGVFLIMVYLIFAMTLYLLPPSGEGNGTAVEDPQRESVEAPHR
jgi:Ca2+:H+ antiporter